VKEVALTFSSRRVAGIAGAATLTLIALAAAGSFAATGRSAVPGCPSSGLVVWLDTEGSAAAGTAYYKLKFTNLSGRKCTLLGYPGVSAIDLRGHQLGSAAGRTPPAGRRVTLGSGRTATALLGIAAAANFRSSACHRVNAAGLRVYPPNQTQAKVVPFPFAACSRRGPVYLNIRAVR
jgi:hypothetical protein